MATYYVNAATGDDGRSTAEAANPNTPWLTLLGAEAKASGGDTVHVAAGTYKEDHASLHCFYTTKGIEWIADGAVVVQSVSTSYLLVAAGDVVASWDGFEFDGEDNTDTLIYMNTGSNTKSWTDCIIKDTSSNGHWFRAAAADNSGGFDHCTFTNNNALDVAFFVYLLTNFTLHSCTITGTCVEFIYTGGASGTLTVTKNICNVNITNSSKCFVYNSGNQAVDISDNDVTFTGTPGHFVNIAGATTGAVSIQDNTLDSAVKIFNNPIQIIAGTHAVTISGNEITITATTFIQDVIAVANQPSPIINGNNIDTRTTASGFRHIRVYSTGVDCGNPQITDNICYTRCTVSQCILVGADATDAGDNQLDGAIISGNRVYGGLYYNRSVGSGSIHGIEYGWNVGAAIHHNYVNGCAYGIVVKGGSEDYQDQNGVYCNLLVNNGCDGFSADSALRLKGVINVPVYGNVFYSEYAYGSWGGLVNISDGDNGDDDCTGCLIKNNIFYAPNGSFLINVADDGSSLTAADVDNNCYWNDAGSGMDFIEGGTTYTNFADWQTAGFDASGFSSNPNWVDPGSDFQLQSSSPCKNTGVTLASPYNIDFAGNDQDDYGIGWDVGAYAFLGNNIPMIMHHRKMIGVS